MRNYERDEKMEHINTLKNYMTLVRKPVSKKNCDRMLETQNRKIHELMKIAYEIPFYRERFEASGTTPDAFHNAQDLYKFPLLTKDEVREWMDGEAAAHPEKYEKGLPMELPETDADSYIYVAGAKKAEDGSLLSNGGRVLGVTAVADSLKEAIDKAYALTKKVKFDGGFYRNDIGARALKALK